MTFLEERDRLLHIALKFEGKELVDEQFKRDFFNLVTKVIVSMQSSEDNFFGGFMIKVQREMDLKISYPLSTVPSLKGFIMYFNPLLFLSCSEKEMAALFKHEIYHMMYLHYIRIKDLKNKYSKEVINIAMDIAINQFVKDMPMECYRLESINREFNMSLKENEALEVYAGELQKTIKDKIKKSKLNSSSLAKEFDISTAHDKWENLSLNNETLKESVKKIALTLKDTKQPQEIKKLLATFYSKEELSWESILKGMLPKVNYGHKKTITRRDRRQPNRMDLRGVLPNHIPEIILAIDISASMSDEDFKNIIIEVFAIVRNRNAKIRVIECDNEVRRDYKLQTPKDIKPRSKKNGSTLFFPVFKYIKDKGYKDSVVIYFTDGVGEKELLIKPINKNILWVITGKEKLSLNKCYGVEYRINKGREKEEEKVYALDLVREVVSDMNRETSSL